MFVPNFMAIHAIVIGMFWSGTKWWTEQPADRRQHPLRNNGAKSASIMRDQNAYNSLISFGNRTQNKAWPAQTKQRWSSSPLTEQTNESKICEGLNHRRHDQKQKDNVRSHVFLQDVYKQQSQTKTGKEGSR